MPRSPIARIHLFRDGAQLGKLDVRVSAAGDQAGAPRSYLEVAQAGAGFGQEVPDACRRSRSRIDGRSPAHLSPSPKRTTGDSYALHEARLGCRNQK